MIAKSRKNNQRAGAIFFISTKKQRKLSIDMETDDISDYIVIRLDGDLQLFKLPIDNEILEMNICNKLVSVVFLKSEKKNFFFDWNFDFSIIDKKTNERIEVETLYKDITSENGKGQNIMIRL